MKKLLIPKDVCLAMLIILIGGAFIFLDVVFWQGKTSYSLEVKIIYTCLFVPIFLVLLNIRTINTISFKEGLMRYCSMLGVLFVICALNSFKFVLKDTNLLGIELKCLIVDAMSWVIVYLYVGFAVLVLTIEWIIALFIKNKRNQLKKLK